MPRLHALELLPDAAGEAAVRRDWQALREAGLPSMLDHAGATNTPHVTVVAVPAIDGADEARAVDLLGPLLPIAVRASAAPSVSAPSSASTTLTGLGAASTISCAGFGGPYGELSRPEPPVTGVWLLAPKPSARPLFSSMNFCWSTWLMANSTMNSAIRTVIMSA